MSGGSGAVRRWLGDNPGLRWLVASAVTWYLAERASLVALVVIAFSEGGADLVAILAILQTAPSVVLAPTLMGRLARFDRDRLLRALLLFRVVSFAVAALLAWSPLAILVFATIDGVSSTLLHPVRSTLTPWLARTPEELVATNVAMGTGMSAGALVGPAIAGALLVVAGPTLVLGITAAGMAVAFGFALGVRPEHHDAPGGVPAASERRGGMRAALVALRELPGARVVLGLVFVQRLVRGMQAVLIAAVAFDALGIGDAGVGLLQAALGLGGLAGTIVAAGFIRRGHSTDGVRAVPLADPMLTALAFNGGGLLVGTAFGGVASVAGGLAVAGAGRSVFDLATLSLLQRLVPTGVRASVLALQESLITASLAIGSILAARLVDTIGALPSLAVSGLIPLTLAVVSAPRVRRLDAEGTVPAAEFALLRSTPLFRPLPLDALELLAGELERIEYGAGDVVVRQDDPADRYFLVESGRLEVEVDGVRTGTLGPGDAFGEIALLRRVPRTATVRAAEASTVRSLRSEPFIAAVSSSDAALRAADEVIRRRLGPETG